MMSVSLPLSFSSGCGFVSAFFAAARCCLGPGFLVSGERELGDREHSMPQARR